MISTVLLVVFVVVSVMFLIRTIYINFTDSGKKWKESLKYKNNNIDINDLLNGIYDESMIINERSETLLSEITTSFTDKQNIKKSKQFECICLKDSFEITKISDSFLKLLNFSNLDNIKKRYINNKDEKFLMSSLFNISKETYEDITKLSEEKIIENVTFELNSKFTLSYIKFKGDIFKDQSNLIFTFDIYNISPKLDINSENFSNFTLFKKITDNLIIDLPFPLFIINDKGIKFLNKSCCEWFDFNYNIIEELKSKSESYVDISTVFNKIDEDLTSIIKDYLNDKTKMKVGYGRFIYKKNPNVQSSLDDKRYVCDISKPVVVQIIPFFNINNTKEIMVTLQEEITMTNIGKEEIPDLNTFDGDNKNFSKIINKNNELIEELINVNNDFKSMFLTSNNIGFGRIDINTYNLIISNNFFEESLKTKNFYNNIINNIIERKDDLVSNNFNIFNYDIITSNKLFKILYSYIDKRYADILIIENYASKYLSNNNIKTLSSMLNISNLPTIIVDKDLKIISLNNTFNNFYQFNFEFSNLLELIPETDKSKVKRAITNALKFNSYNLYDTITLFGKDKSYKCKFLCIKNCENIKEDKYLTITIFPSTE